MSTVAASSGAELAHSGVTSGALKNGSLVTEIEGSGVPSVFDVSPVSEPLSSLSSV